MFGILFGSFYRTISALLLYRGALPSNMRHALAEEIAQHILNVQTGKFHRDAVVVPEDLIAIANMTAEEKEKAKSTLGELSTEALKTVVQAVTTAGLTELLVQ